MTRARVSLVCVATSFCFAAALPAITVTTDARAQWDDGQGAPVDVPQGDAYADTDPNALTDFNTTLDPHGTWVDDATYGTAWAPSPDEVGQGFVPYDTAGRWDYVDGDYSWVSDYDWGWVCFHYGRWAWSPGLAQWLWIPGRLYAGAWVDWRIGDAAFGYVGWAPMPPAWGWTAGNAVGLGFAAPEPWAFAPPGDLFAPGLSARVVQGSAAAPLLGRSRPYVHAQPAIAGPGPAPVLQIQPVMHGPPPPMLGIDPARIPHAANPREVRARQLARPSTALPLGARPPTPHALRPLPPRATPSRGFGAPAGRVGAAGRGRR